MEIVELPGDIATVRSGSTVTLAHSALGLGRGLEPAERLVLRSADGEHHAGEVVGFGFTLEDTLYDVRVGARLPEAIALERAADAPESRECCGTHELVDLLGELAARA